MPRVLLVSTTTGYQTRSFDEAASRLRVDLALATDRCDRLEDPWRDAAIPIRFHAEDDAVRAIAESARTRPIDGVLALADRAASLAARSASALGLPGHPPAATRAAGNKLATRRGLSAAGLLAPWFRSAGLGDDPTRLATEVRYPCVLKPLTLSGSRGVIRANGPTDFVEALARLSRLLRRKDVRALRDPAGEQVVIEGFVEGDEFALEGVLEDGVLHVLALFDKPDPLDGPFFEETIYVTPSRLPATTQAAIARTVGAAAAALGLRHGPVHAECRVNPTGIWVLEVAARPIGGLCSRALRFVRPGGDRARAEESLEAVLLRHAVGESVRGYSREARASAVMMVPIPMRGRLRKVSGVEEAGRTPGVDEVRITAKTDQLLEPLPEGSSYLGFIFARASSPQAAVGAIRAAHARLGFEIEWPLLTDS